MTTETTEPFIGAVAVTSVVCPEWCETSQQHHLNELRDLEGFCHHDALLVGDGWSVRVSVMTLVDGSPDRRQGQRQGLGLAVATTGIFGPRARSTWQRRSSLRSA